MGKFRKKPVVIEARQHITYDDALEIERWVNESKGLAHREHDGERPEHSRYTLYIDTLEGVMLVSPGDWVIRGVAGEFYPCKPEIFAQTYEAVNDD